MKIIRTIKERDMMPCIVFSFSRKECEAFASQMKDVDFNSGNCMIDSNGVASSVYC